MKILIFGSNGQFANSIVTATHGSRNEVQVLSSSIADVRSRDQVFDSAIKAKPDAIINVAAIHSKALLLDSKLAYEVNSLGSKNLAELSHEQKIKYVYVSTDFVYSGAELRGLIAENQTPDPEPDAYSVTKRLGEEYALEKGYEVTVWRISSPFGPYDSRAKGKNFLNNVLQRLSRGEVVNVVDNIFMSPTYTLDSAKFLLELVQKENSSGIWHGSNSGKTSWYEFAKYASQIAEIPEPNPVHTETPRDTSLDVSKLEYFLGREVRSWQEAVRSYLRGD